MSPLDTTRAHFRTSLGDLLRRCVAGGAGGRNHHSGHGHNRVVAHTVVRDIDGIHALTRQGTNHRGTEEPVINNTGGIVAHRHIHNVGDVGNVDVHNAVHVVNMVA